MKKYLKPYLFIVFAITVCLYFLHAQQPERCATDLYTKLRDKKNPACAEERNRFDQAVEKIINEKKYKAINNVVTIPVVVHLLYRINLENLPDSQIQSQIDVMNEDFGRTNADTALTPSVWRPIAANTGIQFCLASRKPNGDPTNGIERRQCINTTWEALSGVDSMKFDSLAGLNTWDASSYLNIWVCNLEGNYLGYTTIPTNVLDTFYDGVVVKSRAFGRNTFVAPPYDKGRTATHEIGHWLGLYHIWCGMCNGPCDLVNDTPPQLNSTSGCPVFPVFDQCSPSYPGIMFMNYMDYTDDACMNMYTMGQSVRMNVVLDSLRTSIHTSIGCSAPISVNEIDGGKQISVYPNPAQSEIHFRCVGTISEKISLSICDVTGKEILSMNNFSCTNSSSVNVSIFDAGVYFLRLTGKNFSSVSRFVLMR